MPPRKYESKSRASREKKARESRAREAEARESRTRDSRARESGAQASTSQSTHQGTVAYVVDRSNINLSVIKRALERECGNAAFMEKLRGTYEELRQKTPDERINSLRGVMKSFRPGVCCAMFRGDTGFAYGMCTEVLEIDAEDAPTSIRAATTGIDGAKMRYVDVSIHDPNLGALEEITSAVIMMY